MLELVQLERRHEEFTRRNVRVIVASMDGLEDSKKTQDENPHLIVLSDQGRGLTDAAGLVHRGALRDGGDTDMPTTFLIDRDGKTRWIFRPDSIITRLSPEELLKAIDEHVVRP